MNKLFMYKKISTFILIYISSCVLSYAAMITIDSPSRTSPNRNIVIVRVMLDPEQDIISGMSGNFSFPSDLFYLESISTESSVVSLWVKQPALSEEKYLDGRTHISFEGIFPGGYDGVRSAYYQGTRPGLIFLVKLIPKNKGEGTLLVDDIVLNEYNSEATPLKVVNATKSIENPILSGVYLTQRSDAKEVESPTLNTFITRDPLINNNAWYLMLNEREQKSSIEKVYVAENDEYHASLVDEYAWHREKIPYILRFQQRTKYVHVKVVYSNNTYAFQTLSPVENFAGIPRTSRILLSVALALLVLYVYTKYFFTPFKKQEGITD